jgi:hypothetical protein
MSCPGSLSIAADTFVSLSWPSVAAPTGVYTYAICN